MRAWRTKARPAKKKEDAEDARIACLIALDRFKKLRSLISHGELARELRAIACDDERAARDERRLLNHVRQDLLEFPRSLPSGRGQAASERKTAHNQET